jgi:hypothetical protein
VFLFLCRIDTKNQEVEKILKAKKISPDMLGCKKSTCAKEE